MTPDDIKKKTDRPVKQRFAKNLEKGNIILSNNGNWYVVQNAYIISGGVGAGPYKVQIILNEKNKDKLYRSLIVNEKYMINVLWDRSVMQVAVAERLTPEFLKGLGIAFVDDG